jgi:hypothetical protein
MGNEVTSPRQREHAKLDKILYDITFTPGEFQFPKGDEEKNISLEILFRCPRGDVGPLPLNQVAPSEERRSQLWLSDVGDPTFCIIVMYRDTLPIFPAWSIQNCVVNVSRRDESVMSTFRHEGVLSGGNGVVYSLTMAPHSVKVDHHTFQQGDHVEGGEDVPLTDRTVEEDTYKEH